MMRNSNFSLHNTTATSATLLRRLLENDTFDCSQEPSTPVDSSPPLTPTDTTNRSSITKATPCPPTPTKTPTTMKRKRDKRGIFTSPMPLFQGNTEDNLSSTIHRIAISDTKLAALEQRRLRDDAMDTVSNSSHNSSMLYPSTTPMKPRSSIRDSPSRKALFASPDMFGSGSSSGDNSFTMQLNSSSPELFGSVTPISKRRLSRTESSPHDSESSVHTSVESIPRITTTPPESSSMRPPASPDMFPNFDEPAPSPIIGRASSGSPTYCGVDTSKLSDYDDDDHDDEFSTDDEDSGDTPMASVSPPRYSQDLNLDALSPSRIKHVPCRISDEIVHENPFSPDRKKSRNRNSMTLTSPQSKRMKLDISASAPIVLPKIIQPYVSRYLEDFEEIKVIGNGSFGRVTKVRKRLDGMDYAVKRTQRTIKGPKDKEKTLREVFALATLVDNPYIVRYFNAWLENDVLFVQTELCEGGSLADKMRERRFAESELKDLLRQVAMGLMQMHTNNLVHLDIKPENIYIHRDGKYKIGDLGLIASAHDADDEEGRDIDEGDSRYLSREMLNEKKTNLTKADIFALGASIYELARCKPLPANGPEWQEIREAKICDLPDFSPEFVALIKAMLHPDPNQRPSAHEILRNEVLRESETDIDALKQRAHILEETVLRKEDSEAKLTQRVAQLERQIEQLINAAAAAGLSPSLLSQHRPQS